MATRRTRAALSYAAFAGSLFLFLAVFLPAVYSGAANAALASLALIAVALGVTYWLAPKPEEPVNREVRPPTQAKPAYRLDPEHTAFDEENWLRVHGSPGDEPWRNEHRHDEHP